MWVYEIDCEIDCDAKGAPPKILPRAPNYSGPALLGGDGEVEGIQNSGMNELELIPSYHCVSSIWLTVGQTSWLGAGADWPLPYGGLYPCTLSRTHTAASGHQSLTHFTHSNKGSGPPCMHITAPENSSEFNQLLGSKVRASCSTWHWHLLRRQTMITFGQIVLHNIFFNCFHKRLLFQNSSDSLHDKGQRGLNCGSLFIA